MHVTSVDRIRTRFPALARREAGRPAAFFDGPGGTQVPQSVARAVADYLLHTNANTHWEYTTSAETDALIVEARGAFADLLGCDPGEVVFGQNMTTLTFHLARTLGRRLGPGDEIVVTRLDHQANVAPWRALAVERGVTIREIPFSRATGAIDEAELARALEAGPSVLAIGAASNAIGTVTPLGSIVADAARVGCFTFVDAVHAAPHALLDAHALGCDALACSPYKFYGPHLGVLYLRRDRLDDLDPPRLECAPEVGPERFETGTLSHEAIVGAAAAVDFLAGLAHPAATDEETRRARLSATYRELHRRGDALTRALWEGLADVPGVALYGPQPGEPRTPTVAFTVRGHTADRVARRLCDEFGVYVSHGDFYASTVIEDLGVGADGLVRAGAACYTTADEVARLVQAVAEVAES